jgi:hypothetical protein
MSQFLNEAESFNAGDDELKQSLRSLKPRSSIDPQALLSEITSRADGEIAVAQSPSPVNRESRRTPSRWWPALTALSWLITAGVWWSSQTGHDMDEPMNGITTAASDGSVDAGTSPVRTSGAGQLGQSIVVQWPAASSDTTINTSHDSPPRQSQPLWLAWLGLDFAAFDPQAGERRWEQIQRQSETVHSPTVAGDYAPGHASATYASLRSEFDTPIRGNWLSQ